jgi:hypothetical protein
MRGTEETVRLWGTIESAQAQIGADVGSEEVEAWAAMMRHSASPGAVRRLAAITDESRRAARS